MQSDNGKFNIVVPGRINKRMNDDLDKLAQLLNTTKAALIRDILGKGILELKRKYELD